VRAEAGQDATDAPRIALRLPALKPGTYALRLMIEDREGKKYSESTQLVTAHAGPLYWQD